MIQPIFCCTRVSAIGLGNRVGWKPTGPVVRLWWEDELGSDLGEEPLDGVAVGSVTQFLGQPENTGATGHGYSDPPVTAVHCGMLVNVTTPF